MQVVQIKIGYAQMVIICSSSYREGFFIYYEFVNCHLLSSLHVVFFRLHICELHHGANLF